MTATSNDFLAQADDYVLGLLSDSETEAFEAAMAHDEALARRVGDLHDRLLPLDLSAPEADVPDDMTSRVKRAVAEHPTILRPGATNPAAAVGTRRSAWGMMAASLAGLIIGFGLGWFNPDPQPAVVAVLLDQNGVPQAIIEDYGNDTAQVRFVADIEVPSDRTMQVWTLPSKEMGATSLGILSGVQPTLLHSQDLPRPADQQLYEITLEPLGGSPTGRPTGPILGKGYAALQGS
ncbi:MAG: anti-sigma factor [Rhodobiaceae bacterium]|nr:anti-sigma factor [Rhodobiaceae bacterium]MCC0054988.1 anti-sigma factor [Rhodobiaceae bacterium]